MNRCDTVQITDKIKRIQKYIHIQEYFKIDNVVVNLYVNGCVHMLENGYIKMDTRFYLNCPQLLKKPLVEQSVMNGPSVKRPSMNCQDSFPYLCNQPSEA
ncbi:hypothetical protein RF11_04009 [Thelohanellus kitauei]|uniref:Uncharacterized protein n=1 Tax=Thelohanellus kitauei TaxID=669202 RepID=A0A0C2N5P5_THEKT|nr:hypothetical protein RF11_04009 [Thelohanellus kitauei]